MSSLRLASELAHERCAGKVRDSRVAAVIVDPNREDLDIDEDSRAILGLLAVPSQDAWTVQIVAERLQLEEQVVHEALRVFREHGWLKMLPAGLGT